MKFYEMSSSAGNTEDDNVILRHSTGLFSRCLRHLLNYEVLLTKAVRLSDAPGVWQKILEPFEKMRVDSDLVKCFPSYLSGEDLFGLTEPTVIRIVESVSK